jgi:heme exporter protein C
MKKAVPALLLLAFAMLVPAPFIIKTAPYEASMGMVSKIFYFHVPSAISLFFAAFVCGCASIVYMVRRNPAADHLAVAAAELSVVIGLIVLVTGPLWARKSWGVWWVWEARLTMTLVMWMVFVSYLLLRRFGGAGSEMLAAAVAIFGMALVPFVYWSVNVWRTMHPTTNVLPSLPASMLGPYVWCQFGFLFLYAALLMMRARLEREGALLDQAYLALEDLT